MISYCKPGLTSDWIDYEFEDDFIEEDSEDLVEVAEYYPPELVVVDGYVYENPNPQPIRVELPWYPLEEDIA